MFPWSNYCTLVTYGPHHGIRHAQQNFFPVLRVVQYYLKVLKGFQGS